MRYYYNSKATAEESCSLKMSYLRKRGMLSSGYSSGTVIWSSNRTDKKTIIGLAVDITDDPYVRLIYSVTDREGSKTDYDYEVSLVTTPCNYGGVRYWFACPVCHERVGVLYLAPGSVYFVCRHCNDITYHSRNRCRMEAFGHTSRQIEQLRSEIQRWTWRGRPTRKVRRLQSLQRKAGVLGGYAMAQLDKLKARISKH